MEGYLGACYSFYCLIHMCRASAYSFCNKKKTKNKNYTENITL